MTDSNTAKDTGPMDARVIVSIVAGGVGGLLLQSATITAYLGASYMTLITTWGRYVVAILMVALFAALWRALPRAQALGASIVAGGIIPALLSRFMFGSGAPWVMLIAFNLIFTALALVIWRLSSAKSEG